MPPDTGPDTEAVAERVFIALADPTRRAILAALAATGPATATDLAERLPITRQAIAKHLNLLADARLVTAEPGERRRVRYRLRSGPMQVAQQFLAALARDWDGPLDVLKAHLDRTAPHPDTARGANHGHAGAELPADPLEPHPTAVITPHRRRRGPAGQPDHPAPPVGDQEPR